MGLKAVAQPPVDPATIPHNSTANIQGGDSTNRWHLSAAQYNYLGTTLVNGGVPFINSSNQLATSSDFTYIPYNGITVSYTYIGFGQVYSIGMDLSLLASNGDPTSYNGKNLFLYGGFAIASSAGGDGGSIFAQGGNATTGPVGNEHIGGSGLFYGGTGQYGGSFAFGAGQGTIGGGNLLFYPGTGADQPSNGFTLFQDSALNTVLQIGPADNQLMFTLPYTVTAPTATGYLTLVDPQTGATYRILCRKM